MILIISGIVVVVLVIVYRVCILAVHGDLSSRSEDGEAKIISDKLNKRWKELEERRDGKP